MVKKLIGRGGPGRGQGRKPINEGEVMVPISLKLLPAQKEKLQRLGGAAWVRLKIDQTREREAS